MHVPMGTRVGQVCTCSNSRQFYFIVVETVNRICRFQNHVSPLLERAEYCYYDNHQGIHVVFYKNHFSPRLYCPWTTLSMICFPAKDVNLGLMLFYY
jgi:hypothetical protein